MTGWAVYCCVAIGLAIAVRSGSSLPSCPSGPSSIPSKIAYGLPKDCLTKTPSGSSCDYFLAMSPNEKNGDFLDIHLEGSAKGWVAVGFSDNQIMDACGWHCGPAERVHILDNLMPRSFGNNDVLGCKQYKSHVAPIDSWNPNPQHTANEIDPNQDGICPYTAEYDDGRIKCTFSRYYGVVNPKFDFDLNNSYYLLLGRSDSSTELNESLPFHMPNDPVPTSKKCDPFTGEGCSGSMMMNTYRRKLIIAHGVLMVISWLLLAVSGIYFAAWLKPSFPDGKWFHFHRILMIASLLLTTVAFALIFIADKDNRPAGLITFDCGTKTAHFVLGVLVTGLQYVNPIIAIFRCKPHKPGRWIFNLLHGTVIGRLACVLALTNIGLGLTIFQNNGRCVELSKHNYLLWIYLGWLGFSLALEIFMYVATTMSALGSKGEERQRLVNSLLKPIIRYFDDNDGYVSLPINKANDFKDDKPSKDAPLRKTTFGIQLSITVIFVVILAIFISLDG